MPQVHLTTYKRTQGLCRAGKLAQLARRRCTLPSSSRGRCSLYTEGVETKIANQNAAKHRVKNATRCSDKKIFNLFAQRTILWKGHVDIVPDTKASANFIHRACKEEVERDKEPKLASLEPWTRFLPANLFRLILQMSSRYACTPNIDDLPVTCC